MSAVQTLAGSARHGKPRGTVHVTREALALFVCAPQVLYAVNRHVDCVPYATTFELADTSVGRGHWSRRQSAG